MDGIDKIGPTNSKNEHKTPDASAPGESPEADALSNAPQSSNEVLESKERQEADASIESLKCTLLKNLQRVLKKTSKELLEASDSEAKKYHNDSGIPFGERTAKVNDKNISMDEQPGSLREFSSSYFKERQGILDTVMSVMQTVDQVDQHGSFNERRISSQQQMQIWTEIATDLDSYYLETLNRYFRLGRMTATGLNSGTLLTYRLSESIVNDLSRSRRKQVFRSREDVHDDIVCGQFQSQFDSKQNTVENLMQALLSRTNDRRDLVNGFRRNEALTEKEAVRMPYKVEDVDDSDNEWIDSSMESGEEKWSTDSRRSSNRPRKISLKSEHNEADLEKQKKELGTGNKTINQLKKDNMKLMEALQTFDEYKANTEKQYDEKLSDVVTGYEDQLSKKALEIVELQNKINEYKTATMSKKEEVLTSKENVSQRDEKLGHFEANLGKLYKCFDEAYQELNVLVGSNRRYSRADADEKAMGDCKLRVELPEQAEAWRSLPTEQEDLLNYFIERVPERLLQVCEKNKCVNAVVHDKEEKSAKSIKEYIDDLFTNLLKSVDETNKVINNLEVGTRLCCKQFKKMKSRYIRTKEKLESIDPERKDLEVKIQEKDDIIASQASKLDDNVREINEFKLQIDELQKDLKNALESLESERQRVKLFEDDMNQSSLLLEKETEESDWLLEMMGENGIGEMEVNKKKCSMCDRNEFCVRCIAERLPFD